MFGNSSHARLLALLALVAALGFAAYFSYFPDGKPRLSESPLADVKVPPLAPRLRLGMQAFQDNCASCHGRNAAGRDGVGPPLVHRIYEPNHHADQAFYLAAKNGVRQHHWRFGDMPPIDGVEDNEIEQIVGYVRRLQEANDIF